MDNEALPSTVRTITGPRYYTKPSDPSLDVYREVSGATRHDQPKRVLRCELPIGHGLKIVAYAPVERPEKIYVDAVNGAWSYGTLRETGNFWQASWGATIENVEPFVSVEVLGSAYTKPAEVQNIEHLNWQRQFGGYHHHYGGGQSPKVNPHPPTIPGLACYGGSRDYIHGSNLYVEKNGTPYQHLMVRVTLLDGTGSADVEFRFERPRCGKINFSKQATTKGNLCVSQDFYGAKLEWEAPAHVYPDFRALLGLSTDALPVEDRDALWSWWLAHRNFPTTNRDVKGVSKVENDKTIAPNLERLKVGQPLLWRFFCWMHEGKLREKTSNNQLLAAMLLKVGADYDALVAELRRVLDNVPNTEATHEYGGGNEHYNSKYSLSRGVCLTLCGAEDKVADSKAKAQWQYAKGVRAKALVLGIDPEKHPLLLKAVEEGKFTLSLFHEAGAEDKLVNVEFNLLERALGRKGWAPILYKIAADAAQRKTYTKRITSYISFLFKIEKYLDRTAPRIDVAAVAKAKAQKKSSPKAGTWTAMPTYVETQAALEMTERTEEGTTKTRSAMTPVADNDAGTITVPYLAMRVSGVVNTWMYSDQYFVAEEGAEDPLYTAGGVYEGDFSEKLNGRDDYGMMYFTLAGTDRNTGYPTFLIIFERTTAHGTKVHFHRVHPSRKRGPNGTETPPSRMVLECYRYMAGNVTAAEIAHQQGDLLLVKTDGPGKTDDVEGTPVYGFENHTFAPATLDGNTVQVRLVKATAKTRGNLLGWLNAQTGMRMPHPEHEPIEGIAPGWYELRRCKSWEANPTSVWVLNID